MDTQNISAEEQINLIENSLKHSSSQKTGARNYYLIWGFVVFAYFMIQYCNAHFRTEMTVSLANLSLNLFAIGGLLSYLQSRKDDKTETIIPLNEKVYIYGWIGASIGLGAICIAYIHNIIEILCFGVLLSFGLANFIIGGMTHFKPLILGGIISMLLCIFVPYTTIEYKFLLAAIGIIFTCIIPGYMMKESKANV